MAAEDLLLSTITTDASVAMDQSELEPNSCIRRQAREKACERGTIDLVLLLIG